MLEEERRALENARMKLVGERLTLRKTLDAVRVELAKNGQGQGHGNFGPAVAQAGAALFQSSTRVTPVEGGAPMEGTEGPSASAALATLS